MNKFITKVILVTVIAIIGSIGLIGCAKDSGDSSDSSGSHGLVTSGVDPENANDVYCLACHGGNYQEHARLTEEKLALGDWNPHKSAHGGYLHCSNCHYQDKELSVNMCAGCHVYEPDPNKYGVK